jgi:hypothetical protein
MSFRVGRAEGKKKDDASHLQLDQILARTGDKGATARYIEAQAKLAQQFAKEIAPGAFDKFLANKGQRESLNKTVTDENVRLSEEARLQAEPLKSFVVEYMDEWINQAKKKGVACEAKRTEAVSLVGVTDNWFTVYEVTFRTGAQLKADARAAVVRLGRLVSGFEIFLKYRPANSQDELQEVIVSVSDGGYYLADGIRRPEYTFKPTSTGPDPSPAKSEAFHAAAREALNQVMGHAIGENSDL